MSIDYFTQGSVAYVTDLLLEVFASDFIINMLTANNNVNYVA